MADSSAAAWRNRRRNDFDNAKGQCLGKRDKSFAGRIDPRAVDACGIINERDEMYTTSSCAGRCFMYRGPGIKASTEFQRFRISHAKIADPDRYFDLSTIDEDKSGGGDPIRSVGQYDYKTSDNDNDAANDAANDDGNDEPKMEVAKSSPSPGVSASDQTIWLRFEPFILHVACRSLSAAAHLMATARPSFKNVGLTTWKERRYLVAIWGDEGLEMPLCTPEGPTAPLYPPEMSQWLSELVNERQTRNWNKIERFCRSLREMGPVADDSEEEHALSFNNFNLNANNNYNGAGGGGGDYTSDGNLGNEGSKKRIIPRSFDVIGDVAYLHSMPEEGDPEVIGNAIMKKNKSIKVVVARQSTLGGTERAPGEGGLAIIAGAQRSPLITTHTEFGIRCVVDLNHCFFTPRMGQERLRICQQVARGEDVLVCFAGVGMEAIQISGRTEASSVVAVELNEVAVLCAKRGHKMLENNKAVKTTGAAERLEILQGDVLEVLPSLNRQFDRILAPRPKEGKLDGDLGSGDGGETFLRVLLKHMKDGGECHWYDFVADHEYPACERTRALIERVCDEQGLDVDVLHAAHVGSVAKRQLRVCLDFKVRCRIVIE
jgi:tRNA G37 N-methylase Trm5/tRNA(Phe) wybutosine-synthesizing methylase Tyw3